VDELNSRKSESYHSWSSNGKWVVISSRREDGVHTRPYLAYLKSDGTFTKPFAVPQKDPEYTRKFMYSFNIPEFTVEPVRVSARVLASFIKSTDAAPVNYESKKGE
jgi:Tol biopolymer transport system component